MPAQPVLVASDVHLGAIPSEKQDAFHAWLEGTPGRASALILNGDLFDFWFEFRRGVPRGYGRTLVLLRELVEAGLPVTLLGGNHDWWGGRFLREEIGVEFLQHPVTRELAGFRTFLAHGDGLGKGDLGYLVLKAVLRGRLTRWAFSQLTPETGQAVAERVSQTEHRYGPPTESDKDRSRALEEWAVAKLLAQPSLDLVVLGHTHIPRLLEVEEGRWYVNAGDWVHHQSWLELRRGAPPRLREWEAEGA